MVPETTPGPELPAAAAARRQPALRRVDLNLANLITLGRLLSVPLAVWLIFAQRYGAAFWVFVAAGISDAVDGYIAKRFNLRTRLGAMLDPAADKTLLISVYVSLWLTGDLPGLLVFLVVLRDAWILLGFLTIHGAAAPNQFDPLYISKVNTLVQITLIGVVLARLGLDIEGGAATSALTVAAMVTTVLSGLSYLVRWLRILIRSEPAL